MSFVDPQIFEREFYVPLKPLFSFFGSLESWPTLENYNQVFDTFQSQKIHKFIPQIPMGKRTKRKWIKSLQAEGHSAVSWFVANIVEAKEIPLRLDHLHDFFNALSWINFYWSKKSLYELYFKIWQENKVVQGTRPRINDWLTTFDEGGSIAVCKESEKKSILTIIQSQDLAAKKNLIAEKKITLLVFGHGLFEILINTTQTINTACLVLGIKNYPAISLVEVDHLLAQYFKEDPRPFAGSFPVS